MEVSKNKKYFRLAGTLFALYVLVGIIIFPRWYFLTLQYRGIAGLFSAAQTEYFVWNIIALALIALIIFTLEYAEKTTATYIAR